MCNRVQLLNIWHYAHEEIVSDQQGDMAVSSVQILTPGERFPMQLASTYIDLLPPLAKKIYILAMLKT